MQVLNKVSKWTVVFLIAAVSLFAVLYEGKLYVVTDSSLVSAFNATTGEPYYAQLVCPRLTT